MSNVREFVEAIAKGEMPPDELLVDRKSGQVRQAGTIDGGDSQFILKFREAAERSLYVFAKAVLGLNRLTKHLHLPVCDLLTRIPPYRKLVLLPRDHLKSSIVAKALPIHILIQPKEHNIYLPKCDGASTRVLLSNETATNAEHFLRWVMAKFETCKLLRALWPHRCWNNPRRESKKWQEKEMMIPRDEDFPEASIETIGVGGAITSRHYNVLIKDDLISIEAANSAVVMQTAIEWHKASRALMDDPDKSLEFIIGTRWAVYDLYEYIEKEDPSVEVYKRAGIEDGASIWPEMFSLETHARLRKEFGTLYPLLYLNNATDPALADFDMEQIRMFQVEGDKIVFDETEQDLLLHKEYNEPARAPDLPRGTVMKSDMWGQLMGRHEYLRRLRAS